MLLTGRNVYSIVNNQQKPYFDADGKPIMEQSAVALVDILGFKERMRAAHENGTEQEELEWLNQKLQNAHSHIDDPSGVKWRMKVFSDNVIVGYPSLVADSVRFEFSQACWNMVHLQLQLARDGLFMRGGIAVGSIHIGDNLVFGHLLNELAEAEKRASYPRIILLQSAEHFVDARPDIKANGRYTNSVFVDENNARYINYLYPVCNRRDSEGVEILLIHKDNIESNMERFGENPDILQKYIWAAKYHNLSCRQSRFYNDPSFMIPIRTTGSMA